jgi:hypothetical protein
MMLPPASAGCEEDQRARRDLALAAEALSGRAEAVLARTPLLDLRLPETSDLDLLAVGDADDFLPERFTLSASPATRRIDLIWLPRERLGDVESLARLGLVGHRFLGSDVIYDRTGYATRQRSALRARFYDPHIQAQRIEGFLDMGFYTVQEIGVTWDFPALALFWIHMAHAACLAAILDGARAFCPNVYTRPFDHLQRAEDETQHPLEHRLIEALHLDVDPRPLAAGLRRIYETVSRRFPEPVWPDRMRRLTRYEYRYFSSRGELEWRIGVAEEMSRQGLRPAAVFYLRFWAYALARLPMVHQRALDGIDVSFVRPSRAVRPELEHLCPEILDDLSRILGTEEQPEIGQVERSLSLLYDLRRQTLDFLRTRGLDLTEARDWRPYEAPSSTQEARSQLQTRP